MSSLLAVPGLPCCSHSLAGRAGAPLWLWFPRLLILVALLFRGGLWGTQEDLFRTSSRRLEQPWLPGSGHGLSSCGVWACLLRGVWGLLVPGVRLSIPRLLPWQADPSPLSHQGNPLIIIVLNSMKVDSSIKGKLRLPEFMSLFSRKRFPLLCSRAPARLGHERPRPHAFLSWASHIFAVVLGCSHPRFFHGSGCACLVTFSPRTSSSLPLTF